ncbi:Xaa-Pro aminopeptidase [Acidithiobacillus concretivorus]|uniref:Xaa-Pro aminopeptidase n=1 Tax=Acidithiobacillus concretivorus TaxID=3063952 RepID=A0ABS5ZLT9_9PROT|nr:Xaa-Pro aminopeptidase [Acidithiobacillus concretivorus]MBU2737621.1 Xaa-Pro aminopeptidase [Acidithiobacillus concretivorus]
MPKLDLPTPDYAFRRRQLMQKMHDSAVAIIPTAVPKQRNSDVQYPFRGDSDFLYLTGFEEPEAVLVLIPGHSEGEQILFCRPRDPARETWDGRRAGLEGALAQCQVDRCYSIHDLNEQIPALLEGRELLFYPMGQSSDFDARVMHWRNLAKSKIRQGIRYPQEVVDVGGLVHEMRLFKDPVELECMRAAVGISGAGHRHAMRQCQPGMMEYALCSEIEHVFRRLGSPSVAYPSIVGGGENACILHYTENNAELRDGDLVLIDAGAEVAGYAGDITRTFPVNGVYSPAQREIYEIVLAAQEAGIAAVRAGRPVSDYHDEAVKVLVDGLRDLKILSGSRDALIEQGAYKSFYMHGTGHWLGLDVHDVGHYRNKDKTSRKLEPGMVLTVEPGLYFAPANLAVPEKWRGIGIRIEDDVVVTAADPEILSQNVPKKVADIEAMMAAGPA